MPPRPGGMQPTCHCRFSRYLLFAVFLACVSASATDHLLRSPLQWLPVSGALNCLTHCALPAQARHRLRLYHSGNRFNGTLQLADVFLPRVSGSKYGDQLLAGDAAYRSASNISFRAAIVGSVASPSTLYFSRPAKQTQSTSTLYSYLGQTLYRHVPLGTYAHTLHKHPWC